MRHLSPSQFGGKIKEYILRHELADSPHDNATLLVAVSGGADSVALLHILHKLGYRCIAAHCNFHLRGAESDRDEQFVQRLCGEMQIPLHITHFDTTAHAARHGISIEMAARELRYHWFEELCNEHGYSRIAVAHHRDDDVETMLINLIRGTGLHGLTGMKPRHGRVIRPLLAATRTEILDYLTAIGQTYVTDSTNLQDGYVRNKIRLRLLPLLEEINPSVKEAFTQTAAYLRDTASVYERAVNEALERVAADNARTTLRISALCKEPECRTLLFEWLRPYKFTSSQVADIADCLARPETKRFHSPQWDVLREHNTLTLHRRTEAEALAPISVTGFPHCTRLTDGECLCFTLQAHTPQFIIPKRKETACVDAALVTMPLTVRLWQQGDKFAPFGMKGCKKLVSDYLSDCKMPAIERERQRVVCDATGRIVWLVGARSDDRFRITGQTEQVIIMEVKPVEEDDFSNNQNKINNSKTNE